MSGNSVPKRKRFQIPSLNDPNPFSIQSDWSQTHARLREAALLRESEDKSQAQKKQKCEKSAASTASGPINAAINCVDKVLCLTSRQVQATYLADRIPGVISYNDPKLDVPHTDVKKLAIQFESIHKLKKPLADEIIPTYDVLIIDECRSEIL